MFLTIWMEKHHKRQWEYNSKRKNPTGHNQLVQHFVSCRGTRRCYTRSIPGPCGPFTSCFLSFCSDPIRDIRGYILAGLCLLIDLLSMNLPNLSLKLPVLSLSITLCPEGHHTLCKKKYFLLSVLNQPCTYFNEWLRVLWRVVKKDSTFSLSTPSWSYKSPSYPSPQPFPFKLKHPSLPVSLRKEAAPSICYFNCQHNLPITLILLIGTQWWIRCP